jgi:hypothetical protein
MTEARQIGTILIGQLKVGSEERYNYKLPNVRLWNQDTPRRHWTFHRSITETRKIYHRNLNRSDYSDALFGDSQKGKWLISLSLGKSLGYANSPDSIYLSQWLNHSNATILIQREINTWSFHSRTIFGNIPYRTVEATIMIHMLFTLRCVAKSKNRRRDSSSDCSF